MSTAIEKVREEKRRKLHYVLEWETNDNHAHGTRSEEDNAAILLYQIHRYYFECSVAYNICFIIILNTI